jgi:hypothetical protein
MEGVRFRSWKRFDDRVSVAEQPSLHLLYCEPKENPRPGVAPHLDLQQFLLEANTVPVIEIDNHNDCVLLALTALSIPGQYGRQPIQNDALPGIGLAPKVTGDPANPLVSVRPPGMRVSILTQDLRQ